MTSFSIVLSVLIVITISVFIIAGIVAGGASTHDVSELRMTAAMERIKPVGYVVETDSPEAQAEAEAQKQAQNAPQPASAVTAMSGADVYNGGCNPCHAAGVLNAPKLGDNETWALHYEKGLDQLVHNAVNGINQMPAKGGNAALNEENIHDAVVYMLTESGIEVPAAEKAEEVAEQPASGQPAAAETAAATESSTAETPPAAETASTETPPAAPPPAETAPAAGASPAETASTETAPAMETASTETSAAETAPAAATAKAETTPAETAAATEETTQSTDSIEAQPAAAAESTETSAAVQSAALVPADIDIAAGKQVYDMACFVCHAGAVPNAPKLGDKEAWAPRLEQSWEILVQHSLHGYNAMPAKGGRTDLSDEQVTMAIGYMVSEAQ